MPEEVGPVSQVENETEIFGLLVVVVVLALILRYKCSTKLPAPSSKDSGFAPVLRSSGSGGGGGGGAGSGGGGSGSIGSGGVQHNNELLAPSSFSQVRKRSRSPTFNANIYHFTKTGSGQT